MHACPESDDEEDEDDEADEEDEEDVEDEEDEENEEDEEDEEDGEDGEDGEDEEDEEDENDDSDDFDDDSLMEFLHSHHLQTSFNCEKMHWAFNCSSTSTSSFTSTCSILVQAVVQVLVYRPGESGATQQLCYESSKVKTIQFEKMKSSSADWWGV